MSVAPTETELQTQWRNAADLLESVRNFADGTVAGAGDLLDVLEQSLEGAYTPQALAAAAASSRGALSDMVQPSRVREFLEPIILEYAGIIGSGSGYGGVEELARSLYEHFHANSLSVKSRDITFDTSATTGKIPSGSITGNGSMSRLTVDERGYDIENCNVEAKRWRCRRDQNNGVREHAEVFEHLGDAASPDHLLRASYGSGADFNVTIQSRHAGAGDGGSLLRNSSFSDYDSTATPKFVGWNLSGTGTTANVTQDTTNYYRSHPGANTDGSLKITADGSNTFTLKQPLANMVISQLDPETPYFYRVMWNREIGSGSGGAINIRMGSQTAMVSVSAQTGWQEILIPAGTGCWFRNFNEDPFDVEIEWVCSSSSGYLLFDDALLTPWDLVDGTYWVLRGGTTPWLIDDTLTFTDSGGAPGDAVIQWWLFVAGLGYLPSVDDSSETFADPS